MVSDRRPSRRVIAVAIAFAAALAGTACKIISPVRTVDIHVPSRDADADTVDGSVVPPDSSMPSGPLGAALRRGRALLEHTPESLPRYVGSNLRCESCHLDGGRRPDVLPLLGAFARYPRFAERTGAVVTIEDRVNYCLTRSLTGRRLPPSSREMEDIVSYLAYLSTGVPAGAHVRGEGIPRLPRLTGDPDRGSPLFVANCARCHGAAGQGAQVPRTGSATPPRLAPALWGARSFSIGAGLARIERLAAFIRLAMPYDRPGTLSDQDAFDLAAYILAHPRPDLPGKSRDWPGGNAPADVPYATRGHAGLSPPPLIRRAGDTAAMMVPAPEPAERAVPRTPPYGSRGRTSGSVHVRRAAGDMRRSRV